MSRIGRGLRVVGGGLLAGVFLVAGFGFLTAAGYMALAAEWGAPWAAAAVGAGLLVLGALLLAAMSGRHPEPPPKEVTVADLISAFMTGLKAGRSTDRKDD